MEQLLLLGVALLPALVLCFYIFVKDRVEKEPFGLLFGLLICGVIICFPAGGVENILGKFIQSVFGNFAVWNGGTMQFPTMPYHVYMLTTNI